MAVALSMALNAQALRRITMAKVKKKPYNAAEKRIIHQLGLALVCADIESKVIKPSVEKETDKPYESKGGYLDMYLASDPKVKRAWNALQKDVSKIRSDFLAHSENEAKSND
jgi:hypothetical protein